MGGMVPFSDNIEGAPYIAKLSDVIGRKDAILVCLFGALAGYVITIVALY
jgi:DHA1 family tetracycline resistance protein-like MFS transporter